MYKNILIVNEDKSLHFYDLETFICSKGETVPRTVKLNTDSFVRQISNSPKNPGNILVTTNDGKLVEIINGK